MAPKKSTQSSTVSDQPAIDEELLQSLLHSQQTATGRIDEICQGIRFREVCHPVLFHRRCEKFICREINWEGPCMIKMGLLVLLMKFIIQATGYTSWISVTIISG
ncbi:unnamed protein product [Linum trigynum]|uniref:Uncharacterized protein n=1 Tax=Linum trigynum TaxID=586398 RepID=A0AAV2GZR6_9ROSI